MLPKSPRRFVTAAAASLAALLVLPGALAASMTPEQITELRSIGNVTISPDGKLVAHTLSVPRPAGSDDDGPSWSRLVVTDVDGSRSRTFVGGEVNVSHLRWSPDGSLISYLAKRHGDEETRIYGIPADGGESFPLVKHDASVSSFAWKPDGSAIAFVAREAKSDDAKSLEKKGFKQKVFEEDWRARKVYVASVAEDASKDPGEAEEIEGLPGQAWNVAYSPDGKLLAVDLAKTPLVDDQYMYRRIHVVDAGSGEVQAKIENPGKLGEFLFTADGESIVMISAIDINDPSAGRLMVAPATGGTPRDILPGLLETGQVQDIHVAADGKIHYLASVGVASRVGRVAADGSGAEIDYEADGSKGPVARSMSVHDGSGLVSLVGESPAHPGELFLIGGNSDGARRLTDSNPWLADVDMARQEIVTYEARDGLPVEGLLIHPLEKEDGARVPLIVVAHGGPEAHYSNGWLTRYSYPGQIAAGRGYAVFYPNYRGSTGRGVPFSKADQGDGGGQEFLDVIDGVDHLVERGLVDRKRVGITGGSYGGFFTALAATRHSEHFAAGVMFVGISNQLSKVGTTEIPREMELVHWLTTPYEEIELFLDRSPVMHVDKARTPLLIMHGEEDTRVDPGQSHELYRALKWKGDVPVRLVLYPGEGHGNRRASARYDYSLRMLRWFDRFLLGGSTDLPPIDVEYELGEDEDGEEDED